MTKCKSQILTSKELRPVSISLNASSDFFRIKTSSEGGIINKFSTHWKNSQYYSLLPK